MKELERQVGLPNAVLKKIVEGQTRSPQYETLLKVAQALKVEAGWLMDETGEAPVPQYPFPWPPKWLEREAEEEEEEPEPPGATPAGAPSASGTRKTETGQRNAPKFLGTRPAQRKR